MSFHGEGYPERHSSLAYREHMAEPTISFAPERSGPIRYFQALRRHALPLAVVVALAVGTAAVYSYTAEKRYKASADLLIQPLSPSDETYQGFGLFRQTFDGASTVVTAARLINSPEIRVPLWKKLGSDSLGAGVLIEPLGQANIVTVTATAPDAEQAARVANRYAEGAVRIRTEQFQRDLSRRIDKLRSQVRATPVADRVGNFEFAALQQKLAELRSLRDTSDPTIAKLTEASPPTAPFSPRPRLSMAVAFVVALLLGGGVAILFELLNPRYVSEEELLLEQRLPILARIPRLPGQVARGYLMGKNRLPRGASKEYRILRAVLATLGPDGGYPRSILVAGASPGDGKTTTAVNLAHTLASADMNVILVDGDLHRPMIATLFNLPTGRGGIRGLVSRELPPEVCLVPAPTHAHLRLLLASRGDGASVHLDTARVTRMLEELKPLCDVIVIDSPPLAEVAEVLDMANEVDTVLLTVRLGRTRREKLIQARELLARRGVGVAGFVVTTRKRLTRDEEYGYGYGGYDADVADEPATPESRPVDIRTRHRPTLQLPGK
jgi:Mrp family chromosome partitioning ATPase